MIKNYFCIIVLIIFHMLKLIYALRKTVAKWGSSADGHSSETSRGILLRFISMHSSTQKGMGVLKQGLERYFSVLTPSFLDKTPFFLQPPGKIS